MTRRIEMIEEYIIQQSDGADYNPPSYIWTDNKGQLVRCKDCRYSDTFPENADNDMPLKCLGIRYGGVFPDWYCEHAERKQRL